MEKTLLVMKRSITPFSLTLDTRYVYTQHSNIIALGIKTLSVIQNIGNNILSKISFVTLISAS